MIVVVSVVVVVACFSYLWLLFKDPDRLQTEEYLIRTQALALIEHNPDESLGDIKIKIATLDRMNEQILDKDGWLTPYGRKHLEAFFSEREFSREIVVKTHLGHISFYLGLLL